MRLARCLMFATVLAAACGGKDDAAAPSAPATTEPKVDGKTVAEWCAALESPNTCRLAAVTLARIGMSDPRVLPALHKAIANTDGGIRRTAAGALASLGEPAIGPTAALLDAADAPTRDGAGDALAVMGAAGLRRLVISLGDPSARTSAAAAAALQRVGDAAVSPLTDGLTLGSPAVRVPAAKCLAAMNASFALASALGDPATRDVASDGIRSIGAAAIPALKNAANDPKLRDTANALLTQLRVGNTASLVKALGDPSTRFSAASELTAMGDAALPALLAGLAGDTDAVCAACADLLGRRTTPSVKEVAPLLAHKRAAVRSAAATVLVKWGGDAVDSLAATLGGSVIDARESVAAALRAAGADAIPVYAAALEHGTDAGRTIARRALVAAGESSIKSLEVAAVHGDAPGRAAALDALVEIGTPALPSFAGFLNSTDAALRGAAAVAIARYGAAAVPSLMNALASPEPGTVEAAVRGLGALGAPAVPPLLAAIQGPDPPYAARAGDALGAVGAAAVPELARLSASPPVDTRVVALRALGRIARDVEAAVAPIVEALADADVAIRVEAARALATAGPNAKSAAKAIDAALHDKATLVRIEAAAALVRTGGNATSALASLTAALQDKDATTRRLVIDAIVRTGLPKEQLVPPLLPAMKDPDVGVRIATIRGLATIGATGDAVVDAVAKCAKSSDPEEQAAAMAALPKISDIPVAELLHIGGAFRGDRTRRRQLAAFGGSKQTETAVAAALDWLARHQSKTGEWSPGAFDKNCKESHCSGSSEYRQFGPGLTGLALLCFFGAGESPTFGPHKEVVALGVKYLREIIDSEGCVGNRSDGFTYNHAICTTALAEAYMMTGDPEIAAAAQRAVGFVLKAKNPYLAWRYNFPPDGDNDTSVTGWMVWALATARAAGLDTEKAAVLDALAWIEKMTEPEFGRTGYQERGGSPGRTAPFLQSFPADQSESLTAIGVMIRVLAGHKPKDDEFIGKGAELMVKKLPRYDVDRGSIDFYYWFWGTLAMRQVGGDSWKRWNDAMTTALLGSQRKDAGRCDRGSWDPVDPWSDVGSRIYTTTIGCLCLESYYRMDSLLPATK